MNEHLEFAKELAEEAGEIMTRYFSAEDIGTKWKEDDTPLTVADTMINDLVIDRVKSSFPDHGILGEEASYEEEREYIWVVDPIDGTIPFSLAIPLSTFSLALVNREDGQPVVGVIFDPFLKRLYSACKGKGARLNNHAIKTSSQEKLSRSYVSVIGSFDRDIGTGNIIEALRNEGAKSFSIQSQAYAASRVASGELIGSIFGYGSPWDSAAAALIVGEAGGVVTDLKGKQRRYDKFEDGCLLAANDKVYKELLRIMNENYRD